MNHAAIERIVQRRDIGTRGGQVDEALLGTEDPNRSARPHERVVDWSMPASSIFPTCSIAADKSIEASSARPARPGRTGPRTRRAARRRAPAGTRRRRPSSRCPLGRRTPSVRPRGGRRRAPSRRRRRSTPRSRSRTRRPRMHARGGRHLYHRGSVSRQKILGGDRFPQGAGDRHRAHLAIEGRRHGHDTSPRRRPPTGWHRSAPPGLTRRTPSAIRYAPPARSMPSPYTNRQQAAPAAGDEYPRLPVLQGDGRKGPSSYRAPDRKSCGERRRSPAIRTRTRPQAPPP